MRRSLPATRHLLPSQPELAPPGWQPNIEAPDLSPLPLPGSVPTVAGLLDAANLHSGGALGSPAFGPDAAGPVPTEPLTAAAVDDPVEVIEQRALQYPSALAQASIPGRVELEYVVDTTGRAEVASLRTLMSTHPAFEAAARTSVLATRYRPARLRGRVVRQLVRQTLSFRLAD